MSNDIDFNNFENNPDRNSSFHKERRDKPKPIMV